MERVEVGKDVERNKGGEAYWRQAIQLRSTFEAILESPIYDVKI